MRRIALIVVMGLVLAGCAPAAAPPPQSKPTAAAAAASQPTAPAAATAAASKSKFQELLARAKAANGQQHAVLAAANLSAEDVRNLETAFEQRFGFKVTFIDVPGHESQDVAPKLLQAARSNTPLVDWLAGQTTATATSLMQAGVLKVPPWEALSEEWPQIADLRGLTPEVGGGPNNTQLRDYCMLRSQTLYPFVYNTKNVKPEEVKGLVWDDLLTDKWKNRVAFQDGAGGLYIIPFHKDWPVDRMKAYAQNLGANGLKIAPSGSAGLLQMVVQGEADLGIAEASAAYNLMSKGAPIAFAWADVVPMNQSVGCMPALSVDDPDLSALVWAWRAIEGEWVLAQHGSGGARPFYAPEADKYPLGKLIKDAGLTADKNLSAPQTEADSALLGPYRDAALLGMKTGIQSGTRVPYPWGCQAGHPSCVQ
jgi:ABC-type Fe3+ transport system substrate-binding protein